MQRKKQTGLLRDTSKWKFGDATPVTEQNTVHCYIEMTQKFHDELYSSSNFFNKKINL